MSQEAVIGHEERVYVANEATFRTAAIPATAQSISIMDLDMGPAEKANTRAIKDKAASRDMQLGFVHGRVDPIAFKISKSMRSRSTATTTPEEDAILQAAGLVNTTGSSVVYSVASAPTLKSLQVYRTLGPTTGLYEAQLGLGGVVKTLEFAGGDQELMLTASGAFASKSWLGQALATADDDTTTTIDLDTATDAYLISLGWYQIESEVVKVTAVDYSTGALTVVRGENSTTAAAHASKAMVPYQPTYTPPGVAPISEANCTVTLDGIATRCTKFGISITTGMDHRPGETGSEYVQGMKLVRIDIKPTLDLVLTKELVALIGKANQKKSVTLSILCGTGTGGQVTFSMPTCELEPFPVTARPNDIVEVSPSLLVRGSSGNDSLTITLA